MKISVIDGARPNFIKIAPIINAIKSKQNGARKSGIPELWDGKASERIISILLDKK